jgi:hypothetical protein
MNIILAILLSIISCFSVSDSFDIDIKPAPELAEFDVGLRRLFVILIENEKDGTIKVLTDGEEIKIGEVVVPVKKASSIPIDLWSSHYIGACNGHKGGVVYSGGDSLRIRCGPDRTYNLKRPRNWMSSGVRIVPFTEEEVAVDGDLVVGCPGGEEIFNEWSPYIGNPVYAMEHNGEWKAIDEYFSSATRPAPKLIMIDVLRPEKKLAYIEFENWIKGDEVKGQIMEQSGNVYVRWKDESRKKIGSVVQKLNSHDNFVGTEYAEIGQVSEVTPGEIVLSTSNWYGFIDDEDELLRGGVRIIPINHAKFMDNTFENSKLIGDNSTLIVGSIGCTPRDLQIKDLLDGDELIIPPFMGLPPLFNGYLRPRFQKSDYTSSFRYYVSDDFGKSWRSTMEVNGKVDEDGTSKVKYWTNIRIMIGR